MQDNNRTFNFPSGVKLPFALRKKVEEERAKVRADSQTTKDEYKFMTAVEPPGDSANATLSDDLVGRVFSSEDLEKRIWKATVAMVELQKQVHRGEETYYDETFNHGNIFKGWEGFLDAKDVGNSDGIGGRRVPADFRWFSSSCRSVNRSPRPSPLTVTSQSTEVDAQSRTTNDNNAPMTLSSASPDIATNIQSNAQSSLPAHDPTIADIPPGTQPQRAIEVSAETAAPDKASATDTLGLTNEQGNKRPPDTILEQKIPKKKKLNDVGNMENKDESAMKREAAETSAAVTLGGGSASIREDTKEKDPSKSAPSEARQSKKSPSQPTEKRGRGRPKRKVES